MFSNFLKRFKRAHTREYTQIFAQTDQVSPVVANCRMDDSEGNDGVPNKSKQHRLNVSIAKNLVVKCNLPLNIVESPAFRDFIKDLNPKWEPISCKALKLKLIPTFASDVRDKIRTTLVSSTDVTLTVDAWSDRRCRSFLGIAAHFIDKNFIPQVFLVDFLRFKSPHSGEKIQQMTEDVLDRFDLKEKVFRIVTDNASTMIKAYRFGLAVDDEVDPRNDQAQLISDAGTMSDDEDGESKFSSNLIHHGIAARKLTERFVVSCIIHCYSASRFRD